MLLFNGKFHHALNEVLTAIISMQSKQPVDGFNAYATFTNVPNYDACDYKCSIDPKCFFWAFETLTKVCQLSGSLPTQVNERALGRSQSDIELGR